MKVESTVLISQVGAASGAFLFWDGTHGKDRLAESACVADYATYSLWKASRAHSLAGVDLRSNSDESIHASPAGPSARMKHAELSFLER